MTRLDNDPAPAGVSSRHADLWTLDPEVFYLNHGSFGACPRRVLEFQADLRAQLEREPVDFLIRQLPARMAEAREQLGRFIGAEPEGLAFVSNATMGVNAALRAWELRSGDEILLTDHTYGACRKAAEFIASHRGARVVVAHVPFPPVQQEEVVSA